LTGDYEAGHHDPGCRASSAEEFEVDRMVGDEEGCPIHLLAAQPHIEPFA
jgi:hypothetical protein